MQQSFCWLPGWASDFALWKTEIEMRWPNANHQFVSYPDLLASRNDLNQLPQIQHTDLIIGWSLGSLLALKNAPSLPQGIPLVCLCPVAWFCQPEIGWPVRVVQRMSQKLTQDPKAILEAFAGRMGNTQQDVKQKWIANALSYTHSELVLGLEILAAETVAHLGELPRNRPIHLIAAAEDEVVSTESVIWLERELHPQSLQLIKGMNHWPFSGKWDLPSV